MIHVCFSKKSIWSFIIYYEIIVPVSPTPSHSSLLLIRRSTNFRPDILRTLFLSYLLGRLNFPVLISVLEEEIPILSKIRFITNDRSDSTFLFFQSFVYIKGSRRYVRRHEVIRWFKSTFFHSSNDYFLLKHKIKGEVPVIPRKQKKVTKLYKYITVFRILLPISFNYKIF